MPEPASRELVVLDADGKQVDSCDPYVSHTEPEPGVLLVRNTFSRYRMTVPPGGRYVVRGICPCPHCPGHEGDDDA